MGLFFVEGTPWLVQKDTPSRWERCALCLQRECAGNKSLHPWNWGVPSNPCRYLSKRSFDVRYRTPQVHLCCRVCAGCETSLQASDGSSTSSSSHRGQLCSVIPSFLSAILRNPPFSHGCCWETFSHFCLLWFSGCNPTT